MSGGWGKVGVRLTEQEREQSRRRAARRRNEQKDTEELLREKWRQGRVSPQQITAALDKWMLEGPEVDEKCGVEEPAIDMWEAGELYPTWEQLVALSTLTEFPLNFFYEQPAQIAGGFICLGRGDGCHPISQPAGPTRYTREVVAECPGTAWHNRPPVGNGAP